MKSNIKGLKMAICQMKVVPGMPNINADYMIKEIEAAAERKMDVIIFPEMCVPGYLIGDLWENEDFIKDCAFQNEKIRVATQSGITTMFGSIVADFSKRNEDGRTRKMNCALVAKNGSWIFSTSKTLQPNYRIFDDNRHFFSTRQHVDEFNEDNCMPALLVKDLLEPVEIETSIGIIKSGIILCEDMWHADYPENPAKELADKGAEIIFNISASPWSWQKNRKRHQVVKDLLADCKIPFVYVNNSGIQNNGKNVVIFDGASTVYDKFGNINFEFPSYASGTMDVVIGEKSESAKEWSDVIELFQALECAVEETLIKLPEQMRKVLIGVSGGIDSALSAALHVHLLGRENVLLYYMPSDYSSEKSFRLAMELANNLGVNLQIISIQGITDSIARLTGVEKGSLAYENIQARARREVLAASAQKIGGVYPANFNKVEAAFGYGTMYGDIAGYLAPFGDCLKREMHQIGRFMNEVIFGKEIIPEEIFTRKPTAELASNQEDPFDYGDAYRYGYHDQMVRAFVEFRKGPTWFMENYFYGKLEQELKLESGLLKVLFPKDIDFINDFETNWKRFHSAVYKRVQAPPIAIVSKRAFGYDLRESILPAYLTERYLTLKKIILDRANKKPKKFLWGFSGNPVSKHHRQIVENLVTKFGNVVIIPCWRRPDKDSVNGLDPVHRLNMAKIVFGNMPGVEIDAYDFENQCYTPTYLVDERYKRLYPHHEIWHVFGGDIFSEIDTWEGPKIRKVLNFVVLDRPGYEVDAKELPQNTLFMEIPDIKGSGTIVRDMVKRGENIDEYVDFAIAEYIRENSLYLEG